VNLLHRKWPVKPNR